MTLDLTRLFVAVVRDGGFSRAAAALKVPKSTVSKGIARLERELGAKLLVRTTRALAPTDAGRAYYEAAAPAIATLDDAQRSLISSDRTVAGQVRITAPEDLGALVISPLLATLTAAHPALALDVRYTDVRIDLVRERYDLAIRIGPLSVTRLYAKKLGESTQVTVAAPQYLARAPRIRRPLDLREHACLANSVDSQRWTLSRGREREQVEVRPRVSCNQMTSLLALAVSGAGVALVPAFLANSEIAAGRLVRVLPEWGRPGRLVSMVSPLASSSSARLQLVSRELGAAISRALVPAQPRV